MAKVAWSVVRGDGSIEASGVAANEDDALNLADEAAAQLDADGKTHYVRIGDNEPLAYNLKRVR